MEPLLFPATGGLLVSEILNTWKDIAAYLGRGVRTVQRWERFLGLPVRRPYGRKRSTVIAIASEIDAWLTRAGTLDAPEPPADHGSPAQVSRQKNQKRTSNLENEIRIRRCG
jgi:hypothetical protein